MNTHKPSGEVADNSNANIYLSAALKDKTGKAKTHK